MGFCTAWSVGYARVGGVKSVVEEKIIINLECKLLKVVVDTDSQQN